MLESELHAAAGGVTSLVCPPTPSRCSTSPASWRCLLRAGSWSRCRLFPLGALTRAGGRDADRDGLNSAEAGCVGFRRPTSRCATRRCWRARCSTRRPSASPRGCGRRIRGWAAASPPRARWRRAWACRGSGQRRDDRDAHDLRTRPRDRCPGPPVPAVERRRRRAAARQAKAEGLPVTADVSINSLHLTDLDIGYFNPSMRLEPRRCASSATRCIARGAGRRHARRPGQRPHADRRRREEPAVAQATPGATGLELPLSLALKWGDDSGSGLLARSAPSPAARWVLGGALGSLAASAGRFRRRRRR